jgi:hypothetical protein
MLRLCGCGRRAQVVFAAALLIVFGIGCFKDPKIDVGGIKQCKSNDNCPTGYVCTASGTCCRSATGQSCAAGDASSPLTAVAGDNQGRGDGAIDASGSTSDAISTDRGTVAPETGNDIVDAAFDPLAKVDASDSVVDLSFDRPIPTDLGDEDTGQDSPATTKARGTACSQGSECMDGFCVDGFCCESACSGICQVCNEPGSEGTCNTISGPSRGGRTACAGVGECKGQCDGKNAAACLMPGSSTECQAANCVNGLATPASTCNGSGTCVTPEVKQCASNLCATDGSGVCAGSCTSTSCGAAYYCDSSGSCAPKKPSGNSSTCATGVECSSGHCSVEGTCCSSDCTGQCQTCNNSTGACSRVTAGQPVGGRPACAATVPTCGGSCDGSSDTACRYPGIEQPCGTATCSADLSSTVVPSCNGSGACTSSTTPCGSNAYCSGGTCAPKGGGSCTNNIQCTSGNCSLGQCCASGLVSSNGVCCGTGLTGCDGQCVNTNTSNDHCGACTNACSGGKTCSGGACTCPNTSSACGPSCTACGSGQQCTGGSCACSGGAAFVCNACLSWDFESASMSNWAMTSNNATGTLQLAAAAGKGSYSLSIANAQFNAGASSLGVEITLCNGAGVAIPANGFAFSVDVLFQATGGLGFGDDGTGSGNPAVLLEANGYSHMIAPDLAPFGNSTWYTWPWTLAGTSTTTITIRFAPQAPWYGTIYLDNISFK